MHVFILDFQIRHSSSSKNNIWFMFTIISPNPKISKVVGTLTDRKKTEWQVQEQVQTSGGG